MGTKEIIILVVLPVVVVFLVLSLQLINLLVKKGIIQRDSSYLYKYFAILCPPVVYLILKIKQKFTTKDLSKQN